MWLTPCSSSTSSAPSASAWVPLPSAAAPKITRLDSWPVAPKGVRGITTTSVGRRRPTPLRGAEDAGAEPLGAEGTARVHPLHQAGEVGLPLVQRRDRRGVGEEEL